MPRYSKPIDLDLLERSLRSEGFKSTQLTVTEGVEQLTVQLPTGAVVIDQAGNIVTDKSDQDTTNLHAAIQSFRDAQ